MNPPLYLASNSPRRLALLQQLGIVLQKLNVNINETPYSDEDPCAYTLRMATEKADAAKIEALKLNQHQAIILTADTSVAIFGQILGKPVDVIDAQRMLSLLSGQTHQVISAVCVQQGEHRHTIHQISEVTFKVLDDAEIDAYIATGEPLDKAGAYGIQGQAGLFVVYLQGSFTGVMGLPLFETGQLLRLFGFTLPTLKP